MKNFFKKPLNIVAVVAAFLGLLGILLTTLVPGKTYYGEMDIFTPGEKSTARIVLDGKNAQVGIKVLTDEDKDFLQNVVLDGISDEEFAELCDGKWLELEYFKLSYEIKGGKVYIEGDEDASGKINGLKLTLNMGSETYVCTNRLAVAFLVVSCVVEALGLAWIGFSIIKNKKK